MEITYLQEEETEAPRRKGADLRWSNKSEVARAGTMSLMLLQLPQAGEVASEGKTLQGRSGEMVAQLLSLCPSQAPQPGI